MAYALTASFAGQALLSGFDWYEGPDPSHGFVSYQSRANAAAKGLYSVDEHTGVVRLKVDHQNTYGLNGGGRPSIRLESKAAYNHGLFISDFLHMPPSQCGLWPAFWAYGSDWPKGGEVDIIEGVNTVHRNAVTAHTTNGCTLTSPGGPDGVFSGTRTGTNCAVGNQNIGCAFSSPANVTTAYGDGFNAVNGGVYAMLWDSRHIKVWHFERGQIPGDIEAKHPDPKKWKPPMAIFGGSGCNVDSFFRNMKLVININFCGDWGNAVWGKSDQCNAFARTCNEYVARSPQAFANAYWDVRYIDTYRLRDGPGTGREAGPGPHTDTTVVIPSVTNGLETSHVDSNSHILIPGATNGPQTNHVDGNAHSLTPGATNGLETNHVDGNSHSLVPSVTKIPETSHVDGNSHSLGAGTLSSFIGNFSATEAPANPSRIGKYAYLGCFSSRDGFKTFGEVKDSRDMTLEMCVELCDGKKFAGTVDGKCLCAEMLDADTRAAGPQEGAVCDHTCPGNGAEFCGGLLRDQLGAGGAAKLATAPFDNSTKRKRSRMAARHAALRRSLPGGVLVSLYAAVADSAPPPLPVPPMASGMSGKLSVTETAYRTVHPLMSAAPVAAGPGAGLGAADLPKAAGPGAAAARLVLGLDGARADDELGGAAAKQPQIASGKFIEANSGLGSGEEDGDQAGLVKLWPPPGGSTGQGQGLQESKDAESAGRPGAGQRGPERAGRLSCAGRRPAAVTSAEDAEDAGAEDPYAEDPDAEDDSGPTAGERFQQWGGGNGSGSPDQPAMSDLGSPLTLVAAARTWGEARTAALAGAAALVAAMVL